MLNTVEEDQYFRGASTKAMEQFADPALLRDVATILIDCGLRPEECFRLRIENVAVGKLEVQKGKTENARRRIPMTPEWLRSSICVFLKRRAADGFFLRKQKVAILSLHL